MKKLVLKTTFITVISLIAILGVVFLSFSIFAPKQVAGFFEFFNNPYLAVRFYEKHYENTKDINDLYVVVTKVNSQTQAQEAERYIGYFVEHEEFDSFCEQVDQKTTSAYTTKEYVFGKLVEATYINSGIEKALAKAGELAIKYGYTIANPFYILYTSQAESLSKAEHGLMMLKIDEIFLQLDETEQQFAFRDLNYLREVIE